MFDRQEAFMENYFVSQRENIFRNVEVLIYVFDIESRDEELKKDLRYYQTCLSAIYENSPSAKVFCLIHKMDLLQEDQRDKVFIILLLIFFSLFNVFVIIDKL
jgi:Ras-related GTP-binding protein A/B